MIFRKKDERRRNRAKCDDSQIKESERESRAESRESSEQKAERAVSRSREQRKADADAENQVHSEKGID